MLMSVPTKIPKELQAPRRRKFLSRCHIGELHSTEKTTDMACRCPHLGAYLPEYLDPKIIGLDHGSVHIRNGSKRIKRLTISDLHFASVLSEPASLSLSQSQSQLRINKDMTENTCIEPNKTFGEEEAKIDSIMNSEEESYASSFSPSTFVEQVQKERDFERMLCVQIAKTNGRQHEGDNNFLTRITPDEHIKDANNELISKATTSDSYDIKNAIEVRSSNLNTLESSLLDGERPKLNQEHGLDLQALVQIRDQREVDIHAAELKVEEWLDVIMKNRLCHWNREDPNCKSCMKKFKQGKLKSSLPCGDSLMQCLDCSLIGCGSPLTSGDGSSKRHLQQHFLLTNHNFAITCGVKGEIYCMKCGDFVYCEVFESEKERVEISAQLPWFQWERCRKLQRSFAFREEGDDFYVIPNNVDNGAIRHPSGIAVWKGFQATYPQDVSNDFILAAQRTLDRLKYFRDTITQSHFMNPCNITADITYRQYQRRDQYWKLDCPVGIYNAGNICYISSVIQCIFNLRPIQQFFLRDAKHDCRACEIMRSSTSEDSTSVDACLACEIDRLLLTYYGSTQGLDFSVITNSTETRHTYQVQSKLIISEGAVNNVNASEEIKSAVPRKKQGMPIVLSDFLATAWKMKDMALLVGNEQHDANEFMQLFLDIIDRDRKSVV